MGLLDFLRPKRPAIATDARATDSAPANPSVLGGWWGIRSRLVNMMTKAGSATDKASAWRWQVGGQFTSNDLQALDRSGAYAQVCRRLPGVALGQPPTVTYPDNADAAERLTDRAAALGLWGRAAWAAGRGQMDGVAGLLIVSDGVPTEPIDGDKVVRLHKLTRWEMRPEGWDTDIASPTFGSPLMVRIRTRIGGQRYERLVHGSRVILFKGHQPNGDDYSTQIGDGWDDYGWPLAVWIEQAIRGLEIHGQEINRQMATLNLLVHALSVDGQDREMTADGIAATVEMYRQLRDNVSSASVVGTAPGETLSRLESRLTGIQELTDGEFKQLSLNSGAPGEALTGQPPAGLGNGDKGARLTLGTQANAFADEFIRLPLQYALTVLCAESGYDGTLVKMTFADPIPMSEAEYAALYEATTRADVALMTAGVITAAELRAMRFNSGTWSAEAAPLAARTVADPAASAELRAAIMGQIAAADPVQTGDPAQNAQDASPLSALVALLPDADAVKAIESVRQAVAEIALDLDPETWPHLTLLYAGDIAQSKAGTFRGVVAKMLPDLADDIDGDLTVKGLEVWPLPAEGRSVIVLRMGGAGLAKAHKDLWAELTPIMTAKQHPNYKAHVTIGYVPGEVAPDTVAALQALSLPQTLNMGQAVLKHGDVVRLTLPMER